MSLYSYIEIQSCLLSEKLNTTCAHVSMNQPISTSASVCTDEEGDEGVERGAQSTSMTEWRPASNSESL